VKNFATFAFKIQNLSELISITAMASVSALGNHPKQIWEQYKNPTHCLVHHDFIHQKVFIAPLDADTKAVIELLRKSDIKYKSLDDSVLFAIAASRKAIAQSGWTSKDHFGINIGSSRGATSLFEKHHADFLKTGRAQTLASPTTTLGNISSWVAHDLQSDGPEISHSITCSTALHALLNGLAWLRSGMVDKFLVGGSEAPLTDFTVAQMKAMKIYAKEVQDFPCRALDLDKTQNTMILGEGSAVCCLELGKKDNALAYIEGVGYATELLEHNTSISAEADCFQKSMRMALKNTDISEVDVIVMHAPGTIKGDSSEFKAIQKIFGNDLPLLTTNKWKIGHTLGASGMLSIEFAMLMLEHQEFIGVPFVSHHHLKTPIQKVLINAVGFGGNAVSVLLTKA
jgi:3-oxoacyl-(acyl-carrier-protein) synthase